MFFVIVGLGNPGEAYRASRHNAGFWVIERLAARHAIGLRPDPDRALCGRGRIAGRPVGLVEPMTWMNRSGEAVARICQRWAPEPERLAVVHDDIDLQPGRIQLRRGGGDGGHRGLRSVIERLGRGDFVRLRLGVGRPPAEDGAVDHVLSGFSEAERARVDELIERAADALTCWLGEGLNAAMNRFNPWRPTDAEGREASNPAPPGPAEN